MSFRRFADSTLMWILKTRATQEHEAEMISPNLMQQNSATAPNQRHGRDEPL